MGLMKLQITLTKQEEELLSSRAEILGYDVTKYVKFILAKEALTAIPPIVRMNDSQIEKVEKALQEDARDETRQWNFEGNDN